MKLKNVFAFAFTIFISCSLLSVAVENSIVPKIEEIESIDNILPAKYSKNQFYEIANILEHKAEKIRIISYNTLFNLYDQYLDEANRWPRRLPRIINLLDEMQPDVIGVQELYTSQSIDLLGCIGDVYDFFARDCEDGELNGIFYRKDRFELLDSHVWYMTETPDVPSSETLTMVKLKDLITGKSVAIFNTHLAFGKIDKRDFQARFINRTIEPFASEMSVILTGDLNTFPNRTDLENLPFYDGDYIQSILTQGFLKDAKDVSILGHLGPMSTFSNHGEDSQPFKGTGTPGVFLDHIYVSKGISVIIHAVQGGTVHGHYPSDHLPVMVDFVIQD